MEPEFELPELSLRTGPAPGATVRLRPAAAERLGLRADREYRVLESPPVGIDPGDETWVDADGLPRPIPAGQIERRRALRSGRA